MKMRVGICFSPFSTLGDLKAYYTDEVHETYAYLAKAMNELDIQYIHISANPAIPQKTFEALSAYKPNGIPAKVIIDPNGKQRFLTTGFSSDTELINEMKAMIQLVRDQY